jgi:pimeloyl-ACP methyl ester carboxylesterase
VIYFLPWHISFAWSSRVGLVPLDFLACYEMPPSIVSPQPHLCVQTMLALVGDAEQLLRQHSVPAQQAAIVGLSAGTFPATYLANRIGARLCSVASIDRADLAVWLSPATQIVKLRRQMPFAFAMASTRKQSMPCTSTISG